jgi:hypothetical protein
MDELRRAAQRLRESIQSLAQQPAGPQREVALKSAREALWDTQQAMADLPPELRIARSTPSGVAPNYAESMRDLQAAADRLYDAIHAMVRQPAGERRNDAVRQADEALRDTQTAMVWLPLQSQSASSAGSDATAIPGAAHAVSGGVGLDARAVLSSEAASDHNVKMVFSLDTGNYVSGVDVKVRDGSDRVVVNGMSDGPWLYAKLAPGTYTAQASYGGHTVTERFTVGRSGQRVAHFRWPASVEDQVAASGDVRPILGTGPQEPHG